MLLRYLLMGSELGTETNISISSRRVFSYVSTYFRLGRERRFYYDFCGDKLVVLSFRQYRVEIESKYKNVSILIYFIFSAHAVLLCQG